MKKINYKEKDAAELTRMLSEARASLSAFRFGATGSKSKNVKEGMTIRRNIARMLTELASKK